MPAKPLAVQPRGAHDQIRARCHRRQRPLRHAASAKRALANHCLALGRGLRSNLVCRARRLAAALPPAPRPRPQSAAIGDQFPCQHRCSEAPGVTDLVSISACGSLKEALPPGHFVLVDQFIDRTFARAKSFFGPGCVAHVSMADPVSPGLVDLLEQAARAEDIPYTRGGTYLVMEGPQFSTRAESNLYRSWGCSVIGMTNMPEAKLAREAEICYATVAMVTDYDCWHSEHSEVDVASVIKVLHENIDKAHALIARLARDFPRQHPPCPIGSDRALDVAIITPPGARDPAMLAKLDAVAGRVLNA